MPFVVPALLDIAEPMTNLGELLAQIQVSMPPVRWCSRPSPTSASPGITSRPCANSRVSEYKARERLNEVQFWCEFPERRPRILGALLEAA
jgi:hypothetical protein